MKMKVLNPQYMGEIPLKMKETVGSHGNQYNLELPFSKQ